MSGNRRTWLVVAVACALVAALVAGPAVGATALDATLSDKVETPKAGSGTGSATITLNASKGRVCYAITVKHVGTMMAGHIHKGGKGVAGPISLALFTKPTKSPKGCVKASKSLVRAILKKPSAYYVNVHTAKFPAGAARGQLH